MYIQHVISYGNAWANLNSNFPIELSEIQSLLELLTLENIAVLPSMLGRKSGGLDLSQVSRSWRRLITDSDWKEVRTVNEGIGTHRILMRNLGHIKSSVSISLPQNRATLNRWLYTLGPIAVRNGLVDIPIAAVPLTDSIGSLFDPIISHSGFESILDELVTLSPLSHGNPFIILGLSATQEDIQIIELESENGANSSRIVVNRSIEFPAEYHQAGLGILSYFGTVLREKYPNNTAKVKIEQDGSIVRLIVESENGDKEIIEKVLQEYEMVVRGETEPENFMGSIAKVLELKSELRIAQVRIEGQRDLIEYQGHEIATLKEIIGYSLSNRNNQPVSITVSPIIQIAATSSSVANTTIDCAIPEILEKIQLLSSLAADDASMQTRLLDMEEALGSISTQKDENAVRDSSGLQKLKKLIEEASETGTAVNGFFGKISDGFDVVQKLAKRYNDIAGWCGAPQVPSILLGKNS